MLAHCLLAALAPALLTTTVHGQGMYSRDSAVLQVDAKSYHKLITKSNQVSIIEFYAPWCGHCQSLKPKYERVAKNLENLAQVAAIDCDDENNRPLCGSMGIKGFPTLKLVKPTKKPGQPIIEDYQGQRESKDITEAVKLAIPNNVKKVTDKGLSAWLDSENATAKAILFSEKGVTNALTKVLANEFLGKIIFGQARNKEVAANRMFGITEYPSILVLPGGAEDPVKYDGAFTKPALKEFLYKHGSSTGSSTIKEKVKEKTQTVLGQTDESGTVKPAEEDEYSFSSASSSQQSSEASSAAASATEETLIDETNPTESPEPAVTPEAKPIPIPNQPEPIVSLEDQEELRAKCLGEKTSTCVLALLPIVGESVEEALGKSATTALASLAELAEKHKERKGNLFPFFSIPALNPGAAALRTALNLAHNTDIELIAVNGRRGWFRRFEAGRFDSLTVETWIDNIRFGEGAKGKLPEDLLGPIDKGAEEPVAEEATAGEPNAAQTHGEL